MKLTIEIDRDHIERGVPDKGHRCAAARALFDAATERGLSAIVACAEPDALVLGVVAGRALSYERWRASLNAEQAAFITAYDSGETVQPVRWSVVFARDG